MNIIRNETVSQISEVIAPLVKVKRYSYEFVFIRGSKLSILSFMKLFKILLGLLASVFLLAIIVLAGSFLYLNQEFKAAGPLAQDTFIIVDRGEGLSRIADILSEQGAIEEALIFKLGTRLNNAQGDLKAGEYLISAAASPENIMQILRDGKTYQRRVTIPEGLTSYEIVQVLNQADELSGTVDKIPPEGALLPETYSYQKQDSRADKIQRMQDAMHDTIEELWPMRAAGLPFETKAEAITLASIIEKETAHPEERRRVAGVFINRLRQGMLLQTDPSVIYAITKGKHENDGQGPLGRRLLKKDLEFDSPYNTYKYPGLPPGPIANPGRASIEAALNPEVHDYLYFVADGSGGHAFGKTLAEHNSNVAEWRKIRRAQQD